MGEAIVIAIDRKILAAMAKRGVPVSGRHLRKDVGLGLAVFYSRMAHLEDAGLVRRLRSLTESQKRYGRRPYYALTNLGEDP